MTAALIDRPGNTELEIWSVYYGTKEPNKPGFTPKLGAQRFKSRPCAEAGVNPLESGYVLGFAQVDSNDQIVKVIHIAEPVKSTLYYGTKD